jgi:hypothetical protein
VLLEAEADAVGDPVRHRREEQQSDAARPRHRVRADLERQGDDVAGAGERQHEVERDGHGAQRGATRGVPRAIEQVMLPVVPTDPRLDERVHHGQRDE